MVKKTATNTRSRGVRVECRKRKKNLPFKENEGQQEALCAR
jgi:hypothetical protein